MYGVVFLWLIFYNFAEEWGVRIFIAFCLNFVYYEKVDYKFAVDAVGCCFNSILCA